MYSSSFHIGKNTVSSEKCGVLDPDIGEAT
jgi:hypothetical protein